MAAVIGSAKTLRRRWRELTPEQRESFLGLIDHETNRLADLVADVLDTSRIESGQFSYSFTDVDVGELVQEPRPQRRAGRTRSRSTRTSTGRCRSSEATATGCVRC